MSREGPSIESLTRRLAECPPELLGDPKLVDPVAILSDLLRDLGGAPLDADEAKVVATTPEAWLRTMLIGAWLLHDPWFRAHPDAKEAHTLLFDPKSPLGALARLVAPARFTTDPDRREELARVVLAALDRRPAGETDAMAADRARTLDTIERASVLAALREAEARAQKVREAMAKKAAEEAVVTYSST